MKKLLVKIRNAPYAMMNAFAMKRKHVACGKNLQISGRICFHGSGSFVIGDNVTIHSSEYANPSAGGNRTHLTAGRDGILKIGDRSGLSNCAITAMTRVEIGEDVLIGSSTMIADTDFHALSFEERKATGDSGGKTAPILINKGAFIGARCIILKGVTIGENAVIGAGSVVTKDIPANEVWGGSPARFIRKI